MTTEEDPLPELVEKLATAWNVSNSVAWAALFAGADFIHIRGEHDHGRVAIEQGHRTIFDTEQADHARRCSTRCRQEADRRTFFQGRPAGQNVSGVRIVQELQLSLRKGELWRPHKAAPELSLRAPGFGTRNLLSFGESKKQIPRCARDDKTKAFVSLFSETQSVTRA